MFVFVFVVVVVVGRLSLASVLGCLGLAGTLNSVPDPASDSRGAALRFFDLAAALAERRLSSNVSWISRGGLIGNIEVGSFGSKYIPQLGQETVPPLTSTTGFASSGCSSFFSFSLGGTQDPFVKLGIIPLMDASLNTHPQGLKAIKGTVPDISLNESGQTKGDREGI